MNDIKSRLLKIVDKSKRKLESEIKAWDEKMQDTMEFYGVGGLYIRQEKARDKRIEELANIERMERTIEGFSPLAERYLYRVNCGCGNVMWFSRYTGEWFECTYCKKGIYHNNPRRVKLYEEVMK